jgi:hypothetical protein
LPAVSLTLRTTPDGVVPVVTKSVASNVVFPVEATVTAAVLLLVAVKAPLYPDSCTEKLCVKYDDGQPDGSIGSDKAVIVPNPSVNVNALDGALDVAGVGVAVGVAVGVGLADGFGVGDADDEPPGAAVGVAVAGAKLAIPPCGRSVTVPLLHPPRTASAQSVRNVER